MIVNNYPSPCLSCNRVADPFDCDNKNCKLWQKWFLTRWDMIRAYPRQAMQSQHVGVDIGGQAYAHPQQVADFLGKDPCQGCLCPKDLCGEPCRVKLAWQAAKEKL